VPDPVYFDSSVFLAIFMGEASGLSIKELLKELRRDKIRIYTSIVTIQEVSVQTFRKRAAAADNYTKVNKLARIHGITKEIALTAAKLEAQILDEMKPKDREENRQRKWDCFHLATAMELGCRTFYGLDDKQLARGRRFCAGVWFGKPVPPNLSLSLFTEPEMSKGANGEQKAVAKSIEIRGSGSGHPEGETAAPIRKISFEEDEGEGETEEIATPEKSKAADEGGPGKGGP
jgi:predicted nucleic acid-binding protein